MDPKLQTLALRVVPDALEPPPGKRDVYCDFFFISGPRMKYLPPRSKVTGLYLCQLRVTHQRESYWGKYWSLLLGIQGEQRTEGTSHPAFGSDAALCLGHLRDAQSLCCPSHLCITVMVPTHCPIGDGVME